MKETMKKFGAWLIAAALAFAGTGAARAETVKVADQTALEAELVKVNVGESAEFELAAGEFTTYGMSIAQGKTLTFIGALGANGELLTTWKYGKNGTVSSGEGASDYSFEGANVTFRNLVVADNLSVNNYYRGLVRSNGLVFENCTIRNMMGYLGSGDVVFKDCTFDVADVCEYCIKTYSGSSFVFDGCTFKSNNKGFVQVYCEKVDAVRKVMVKNCTFIAGANTSKSAIYFYDYSYGQGATWDIDFVGKNVVTEGHKLWGDMKIGTGAKTRIAINGVAVWENGANVVTVEDVKPVVASAAEFDVVPADGETEIGSGDVEVVEAVMANAAVEGVETGIEDATAGVAADKKYVSVVLTSASVSKADSLAKVVSMTFEVTPCAVKITEGSKSVEAIPNSAITAPITFRFPVDAAVAVGTKADVTHNGVAMAGDFAVAGDDTAKYIEVASATFSTFAYTLKEGGEEPTYAAYIGTTGYETIQAAVDAADISSGAVTIIVKPGTYTEGISLNKSNLQFTEGSVTYYGKISLVGEAGATLKGYVTCNNQNLSDFSISGFTLICDGTTPKTNGTLTPLYLEVASEGGSIRNVRIANNNITGTELGAYVLAASCTGIEFSGNTVSSSGYHLKVGSSEGKIDDVTISGNAFGRLIGIYGSVGENGVSVSGNTFSCSGYAMWINNSSGSDYAKPISFSDNAFATSVSYVIGFTGKVGKSVLKIDEGNTFDGIGITGWADVANHEVFINGNAKEGLALYYDTKLYLGDETAFATLDAAVAASKDDEPITIVNYDSSMKAPEGWEFKTEGGVTKLVKKVVAVAEIVETGVNYETLQEAIYAADGKTVRLLSDVEGEACKYGANVSGVTKGIDIYGLYSITLDLNGHMWKTTGTYAFFYGTGKVVTIVDRSDGKTGKVLFCDSQAFIYGQGLKIAGGMYNKNIASSVAPGYDCIANTDDATKDVFPYVVAAKPIVAEIVGTGVQYSSLQLALDEVTPSDVVQLVADCDETVRVQYSSKFQLNGFKMTGQVLAAGSDVLVSFNEAEGSYTATLRTADDSDVVASVDYAGDGRLHYFMSLREAFGKIDKGTTVTLLKDISMTDDDCYSPSYILGSALPSGKTFDGGGHSLIYVGTSDPTLLYDMYGTIKNLNLDGMRSAITLYMDGGAVFDQVRISGSVDITGGNFGAFAIYPYNTSSTKPMTLTFRDCEMAMTIKSDGGYSNYNAAFLGNLNMIGSDATFNFERCVVTGNILCGMAAMFYANPCYKTCTVNAVDCYNEGIIHSMYMGSDYVWNPVSAYGCDGSAGKTTLNLTVGGEKTAYDGLSKFCTEEVFAALKRNNGKFLHGPADEKLALQFNDQGGFAVTAAGNENAVRYVVSLGLYSSLKTGGSGFFAVEETIDATMNDAKFLSNLMNHRFVDSDWVAANPTAIVGELCGCTTYTLGNETFYYIEPGDRYRWVHGEPAEATVYTVSAYDEDGTLLSAAVLSEDVYELKVGVAESSGAVTYLYDTLEEGFGAVPADGVITLFADNDETFTATVQKEFGIVAGEYAFGTITPAEGYALSEVETGLWHYGEVAADVAAVISADGTVTNKYATLPEALDAATDGQTVQLIADCGLTGADPYVLKKSIDIDLNGKTLALKRTAGKAIRQMLFIGTDGGSTDINAVTLYTSVVGGKVTFDDQGGNTAGIKSCSATKLTVGRSVNDNPVVIESNKFGIFAADNSHLVVNSADITAQGASAISTNGSYSPGTDLTINGGTFVSNGHLQPTIYNPAGRLVIHGGAFSGDNAVWIKAGSLTIDGGVFTARGPVTGGCDNGDTIVVENCNYPSGVPVVSITGGAFSSANGGVVGTYHTGTATEDVLHFVTGGVFNKAPAENTVATGYEVVANPDEATKETYPWKVQEKTVKTEDDKPIVIDISEQPMAGEPSVPVQITVTQELAAEILPEGTDVTKPLTEEQVTAIVTQLETKGEDGMTGWQKYTAGFSQTDKHPLAPKGQGGENGQLVLVTSLITPKQMSVDTGVKVKYILLKGSDVDEKTGLPTNWTKVQELPTPEFPVDVTQLDPETYWKIDVEYTATKTVEVPVDPAN